MALAPLDETQKQAALAIAKAYWATAFRKQYPNATKEQRLNSWKQSRKDYVTLGRAAVRQLQRSGFKISGGAPAKPRAAR